MGENVGDENRSSVVGRWSLARVLCCCQRGDGNQRGRQGRPSCRRFGYCNFCQLMFMRVADDLRDAGQGGKFFGRPLGVATGHHDLCPGIFAVDPANGGAGVLIGGGGDRAGVQDDDFGVAQPASTLQSQILELAFDGRAVGLGRPAPKILYVKTCHHTIVAAHSGPSRTSGTNRAIVLAVKEVNIVPSQHTRVSIPFGK